MGERERPVGRMWLLSLGLDSLIRAAGRQSSGWSTRRSHSTELDRAINHSRQTASVSIALVLFPQSDRRARLSLAEIRTGYWVASDSLNQEDVRTVWTRPGGGYFSEGGGHVDPQN